MILKDDNIPRNCRKLARVAETYPDEDGLVRKVKVAEANRSGYGDGSSLKGSRISHLDRPVQKLVLLMPSDENEDRGFPSEEP